MGLSLHCHRDLESTSLRRSWEKLSQESTHQSLFCTDEWCRSWARHLGQDVEPEVVLFVDEQGNEIGLLPVCIRREGPLRWMKFMGREGACGDHLDLLCAGGRQQECLTAWTHELDSRTDLDGVMLGEIHVDSMTRSWLWEWAKRRGHSIHESEPRELPYSELPDSFEAYLESLSANMRYHVRRRLREFQRSDDRRWRVLTSGPDVMDGLKSLFQLHQRRWEQNGQAGVLGDRAKQQFLSVFCAQAAEHRWVRLHQLCDGGIVRAALLAFHWGQTAYFYQMGWEETPSLKSPGVVLLARSMAQAIDEGMRRYDFLRGEEAYKQRWTNGAASQVTVQVAMSRAAKALLAGQKLKDHVRDVVQRHLGERTWSAVKRAVGVKS